jgi:hypothetical protein
MPTLGKHVPRTISKIIERDDTTHASVLAKIFNDVLCGRIERFM